MRVKWIDTVIDSLSEFCALAYRVKDLTDGTKKLVRNHELRFLIKLKLNPNDKFDRKLVKILDGITKELENRNFTNLVTQINELIGLSQDMLKLEWEGVKEEFKRGNLTKEFKRKIYKKYLRDKANG